MISSSDISRILVNCSVKIFNYESQWITLYIWIIVHIYSFMMISLNRVLEYLSKSMLWWIGHSPFISKIDQNRENMIDDNSFHFIRICHCRFLFHSIFFGSVFWIEPRNEIEKKYYTFLLGIYMFRFETNIILCLQ